MAPKIKIRRAISKKPAAKAPAAIKGLAGFRKASKIFSGAVDKGVAQQNAALASRASVVAELDARLVYVDFSTNSDRYYVLQALEDPKVSSTKLQRYYAYQRWGRTGTGGVCRLQGPTTYAKAKAQLFKVFKSKTGFEWDTSQSQEDIVAGKYWVVNQSEADRRAHWYYANAESATGSKSTTWCPYDADTAKQVEELYAEHTANRSRSRSLASRLVSTGSFTYRVDLDKMTQENTITGKQRHIRRESTALTTAPSSASQMLAGSIARGASSMSTLPGTVERSNSVVLPEQSSQANASKPILRRGISKTSIQDMAALVRSGEINAVHIPDLRSWLRKHGITATGQKSDLVDRVSALVW